MEHNQRGRPTLGHQLTLIRLNSCFSGTCLKKCYHFGSRIFACLILILMEQAL